MTFNEASGFGFTFGLASATRRVSSNTATQQQSARSARVTQVQFASASNHTDRIMLSNVLWLEGTGQLPRWSYEAPEVPTAISDRIARSLQCSHRSTLFWSRYLASKASGSSSSSCPGAPASPTANQDDCKPIPSAFLPSTKFTGAV